MPSCEAIWCRSLRRLRSRVLNSVTLYSSRFTNAAMPQVLLELRLSNLEAPQPGLGFEGVNGVHESYHTGRRGHDHRVRPGPTPEVLDPPEGLARRHAGRGEDHIVAPDQVVQGKLVLRIFEPVLFELLHLRALRRPHPGLHLSADALHDRGGQDALGRPADPDDRVQVGAAQPDRDRGCEVPLWPDVDARAGLPDLLDEVLVPVAIEDRHGYLRRPALRRLRYGLYVLRDGRVYVYLRPRAGDELAHVHVGGPEHAPPLGGRDCGDRTLLPLDQELQPFDGLDGEVQLRPALAQGVPDAQNTGPRLERPHPAPLVRALLAQDRHLPRRRDLLELRSESLRGERVGLLRSAGTFEPRHLERDTLGYGSVLDGYRCCGRARIGHANGLSDLPCPARRGRLAGEVLLRDGAERTSHPGAGAALSNTFIIHQPSRIDQRSPTLRRPPAPS